MKPAILVAAVVCAALLVFGGAASADTGGPDDGGYRFVDNNSPGGPAFQFIDISTTGTLLPCASADDCTTPNIPIGFPFTFYGERYTVADIDTNGVIYFLAPDDDYEIGINYSNESLPTDEAAWFYTSDDDYTYVDPPAIFPFWDDLAPGYCDGSGVYYQTLGGGASRRFVVQWTSCHYSYYSSYPDCTISVQAQLLQGSDDILMFYNDTIFGENGCDEQVQGGNVPSNLQAKRPSPNGDSVAPQALESIDEGASATVGIQADGEVALEYTYDGTRPLTNGLAICFYEGSSNGSCGRPPERVEEPRPPNIGAGLSGLFAAGSTPAPAPPAVVAPNTGGVVISPPNTGDAGLASQTGAVGLIVVGLATLFGLAVIRLRQT
jgi:hypothetical protein